MLIGDCGNILGIRLIDEMENRIVDVKWNRRYESEGIRWSTENVYKGEKIVGLTTDAELQAIGFIVYANNREIDI